MLTQPTEVPDGELVYLELQIPAYLHDAVLRHHQNIRELCDTLKLAGLSDDIIEARIETAVASYREALSTAISHQKNLPHV